MPSMRFLKNIGKRIWFSSDANRSAGCKTITRQKGKGCENPRKSQRFRLCVIQTSGETEGI